MDIGHPERIPKKATSNLPLATNPSQEIAASPKSVVPQTQEVASRKRYIAGVLVAYTLLVVLYLLQTQKGPGFRAYFSSSRLCDSKKAPTLEPKWAPLFNINITECAQLIQDPNTAGNLTRRRLSSPTVFEFPASSEELFLLARGLPEGVVEFIQSDEVGENVKIQVSAGYRSESALGQIRVCELGRSGAKRGLGILSPYFGPKAGIHSNITVLFPSAPKNGPLEIKSFVTDLPHFTHNVGRVADTVHFNNLRLKSSKMPITVGSLSATNAVIENRNSKIEGTFNTSSVLELVTFNAPIYVNVGLSHRWTTPATRLAMSTTNAEIIARMSLNSSIITNGLFKVTGVTSKGAIDFAFIEAPVSSSLLLNAETLSAPANVRLHPTFEGEFRIATTKKHAVVEFDNTVGDPSGKMKRRQVEIWQVGRSHASGAVSWSPLGRLQGSVNIETSSKSILLRV